MSGSGDGKKSNPLEELGNTIADTFVRTANNFVDVATLGHRQELYNGVNQAVGELTGKNYERQAAWERQVAADASAEYNRQVKERQNAAEQNDIAASNAAAGSRKSSRSLGGGPGLNWQDPNKDVTDFLGL